MTRTLYLPLVSIYRKYTKYYLKEDAKYNTIFLDAVISIHSRYLKLSFQKKENNKLLQRFFKAQHSKGFALQLGVVATAAIATGFASPVYAESFTFIPGEAIAILCS